MNRINSRTDGNSMRLGRRDGHGLNPVPVSRLLAVLLVLAFGSGSMAAAAGKDRALIEAIKESPRGPFARIRWFCRDGQVLPPEPYACVDFGGGVQHGEWTEEVKRLRDQGYHIANLFAGLEPEDWLNQPDAIEAFRQMLVERYLINVDDGWIMRGARYYRGAFQEAGERDGVRRLLLALLDRPDWRNRYYRSLYLGVRLLPHGLESASAARVRTASTELAEKDPGFVRLRNKIHNLPEASDADRVLKYASGLEPELATDYLALADEIDRLHDRAAALDPLRYLARRGGPLVGLARRGLAQVESADSPATRYQASAEIMMALRQALKNSLSSRRRLAAVDAIHALEALHFSAAAGLRGDLEQASRRQRLGWLGEGLKAIFATGLIGERQYLAMERRLELITRGESLDLKTYREGLIYLGRLPGWGQAGMQGSFSEAVKRIAQIEPLAERFIDHQLRSTPLFFYSQLIDHLRRDADRLAGVSSRLFGDPLASGLRGLNPGLATGVLRVADPDQSENLDPDGIYLLPETTPSLPPVAGILTAGPGNPLSHVQLLARNLGIPNASLDQSLISRIEPMLGTRVTLAVSPGGVVHLEAAQQAVPVTSTLESGVMIRPDLEKLDLQTRRLFTLSELRARDSGRVVGPKAAKLGELYHHYPQQVADGLVLPFGIFRELLERSFQDTGMSVMDWMRANYRRMEKLPAGSRERREMEQQFRQDLQHWIEGVELDRELLQRLERNMNRVFGADGSYGVFVRSDTNVEDLPGFTGAGLNLTVPNAVGFEQIVAAIPRVWASPFSERAYAWRQSRMSDPEHVYPSVLLMRSVPAEKSGVMVTREIETGDPDWISVAVNEGVGGAVEGQAAESLRIHLVTGEVRLMAQASARERRLIDPGGGVTKQAVSGAEQVLGEREIAELVALAKGLPDRFPGMRDDRGEPVAADIEFGFLADELQLFQIRPFLESRRAGRSERLRSMDPDRERLEGILVELGAGGESDG